MTTTLVDSDKTAKGEKSLLMDVFADKDDGLGGAETAVHARERDVTVISPTLCSLDLVFPSPLNPRKHFDASEMESLVQSVRQHGVLQPILIRPRPGDTIQYRYDIVLGERRWRAAGMAGLGSIPVIIRDDIDDKLHVKLAMEENLRRDDLTTMEKARGFRAMMDAGWTLAEIGGTVGKGKGSVANTLALLDLPPDVQAMIEAGTLSPAHGVALHRYKDFPALVSLVAKTAVEKGIASKSLEGGLNWQTTSAARAAGLLVDFNDYGTKPAFDMNAVCVKNCPFGAFKRTGDNSVGLCLNPDHFSQLQAEVNKERDAKTAADAQAAREATLEKVRLAKDVAAQATTKSARADAEKSVASAEKAADTLKHGLPTLQSLGYGNYCDVRNPPPGCSGDCPCRAKGLDHGDRVTEICVDPKRMASLKSKQTRDEQKERRVRFEEMETQAREMLPADRVDTRALALLLWGGISSAKKEVRDAVSERLPSGGGYEAVKGLLERPPTNEPQAWEILSHWDAPFLVNLATEICVGRELAAHLDWKNDSVAQTKWLLSGAPVSGVTLTDPVAVTETPVAVDTDDDAGIPEFACDRCGEHLTAGCFEEADAAFMDEVEMGDVGPEQPRFIRMTTGEVLTCRGMSYCQDCGPIIEVCSACGCTDEAPCVAGGCTWNGSGVCSSCAPQSTPPAPSTRLFPDTEVSPAQAPRFAGPGPVLTFDGDRDSFDGALFTMLTGGVGAGSRWNALREAGADDRQLSAAIKHELHDLYFRKGATSVSGASLVLRVRSLMQVPAQIAIPEEDADERTLLHDGEAIDVGTYQPRDMTGYCVSCGVMPANAGGSVCDRCDPAVADRELEALCSL